MLKRSSFLLLILCVVCETALAQGRVAIVGGTAINVRDGSLIPEAVVVIEGDRIVSVSSEGQAPADATMVDARGKYLLPGLIDAHVHYRDWAAELFLNHGVTTVLGEADDWSRAQAAGIADGTIPGPSFFHDGRIDGERQPRDTLLNTLPVERVYIEQISFPSPNRFRDEDRSPDGSNVVRNAAEARESMRAYVSGEVPVHSIKLNHNLNAEAVHAIVEEANKINVPVKGHFANARLAADAGASGLEHTWAIGVSLADLGAREEALQNVSQGHMPPVEAFMDMEKLPELIEYLVEKGVSVNPTFRMTFAGVDAFREKGFHHEEVDLLFGDWRLRYIPLDWKLANLKEFWELDIWHRDDLTQYDRDLWEQGYRNAQHLIKAFVDAGGKLHAGTDCASFCVPGLSLHQELELLVDAGITPLQAVQAATIWSAKLMRMEDRIGTIEEGRTADILILDANPLENIRNTRTISRVISRGRMLDGEYHADFTNPIPSPSLVESSSHYFPSPRIRQAMLEGATVTVEGAGFIPYSFVVLNGRKLQTEFIDEWQLKADVPADLLQPGMFPVTVENPNFATVRVPATAPGLSQSRTLDHVSNSYSLLVKPGDR